MISFGESEGLGVGCDVGEVDGVKVGPDVGEFEGSSDGAEVGDVDGENDGVFVGREVIDGGKLIEGSWQSHICPSDS